MTQALQEGTLLHHGKYRIIRILGQGGFGITYLAFDTERNYYVAIKEYFPSSLCNREGTTNSIQTTHENNLDLVQKGKNRFIKEARNLHRLNHPEIVKVYAAFEENHTAYYVMEYIDGISLYHYIQERGPLNEKEALNFITKIAKAVEFIHINNFTHYDLKPQNIMIRSINNKPVLIDFGLSKQFDEEGEATSTMMYAHSEGYSPIELYNREMGMNIFSPQTDIYSIGAILLFLLTGSRPPSALHLLEKGLTIPNHILPQIAYTIKKAMAPFRVNRFQTVGEFLKSINLSQNHVQDIEVGNERTIIENSKSQTNSFAHNLYDDFEDSEENNDISKLLYIGGGVVAIGIILLLIFYFNSYQ